MIEVHLLRVRSTGRNPAVASRVNSSLPGRLASHQLPGSSGVAGIEIFQPGAKKIMKIELLELLRCPQSGRILKLDDTGSGTGDIESGSLSSADTQHHYRIVNGIPRFVPSSNYADNFGMQWNLFSRTQLDSYSGHPISADRFWRATGWNPEELKNQWVLDVGCGSGRFAEIALLAGAKVVALDYSGAVDACYKNLGHFPNLHVVQGDIYALPFIKNGFPFVYSLGVLQHTPNVEAAFAALPHMVAAGGRLCVDYYSNGLRSLLNAKYLLRPLTKRMAQDRLFQFLRHVTPAMLSISRAFSRVPLAGRLLKRLVPVANYSGVYPLTDQQLREWALLDTFDMLAPAFDQPQSAQTVRRWMECAGIANIEVLQVGHLVARGCKPPGPA